MADVKIVVHEEPTIKIRVTDPVIKPTQTKTVTPAYEEQTVLPDAGYTLGQVDVEAIPLPSGVIDIEENGEYVVAGYGTANVHVPQPSGSVDIHENGSHNVTDFETANVNVQPDLQAKEVTPTKQTQTVVPDPDKDGLSAVEVKPIPSQYIIPEGSLNITQNGDGIDVTEKASVNVNVPIPPEYIIPTGTKTITQNGTGIDVREFERVDVDVSDKPTKGVVFGDFNSNGCPTSATTYGFTKLPAWYFYDIGYNRYNRPLVMGWISKINLNEGITDLTDDSCFREMVKVTELQMPSTLTQIGGTYLFNNTPLTLLDMSLLNSVPTLTTAGMGLPSGCTIRVKQSLLAEWQAATNWNALTGVVWEGV